MYRQNVAKIFLKISKAKMQTTTHNYFVLKKNAIYKDFQLVLQYVTYLFLSNVYQIWFN